MRSLAKRPSRSSLRKGTRHIRLTGGRGRDTFLFAPTTALTLPSVAKGIPLSAELPRANASLFARVMARADVLKPEHWTGTPAESIERCIDSMYRGDKLNVCFKYTDDIERESEDSRRYGGAYDAGPYREHAELSSEAKVGGIIFQPNEVAINYTVGHWMDRLEAAKPGLGESVLAILRTVANEGFGIIDPCQAWYNASSFHWEGEEDHKHREQMLYEEHIQWLQDQVKKGTKEEKAKAQTEITNYRKEKVEIFRVTDFKVPKWAFAPKLHGWFKNFRPNDLRLRDKPTLVQQEVGRSIIEAAHECLAYKGKLKQSDNDYNHIEHPSEYVAPWYIRWAEDDGCARVIDDGYEMESQCGESHDISYCRLFEWGDEEHMLKQVKCLPALLESTARVEKLVELIGKML